MEERTETRKSRGRGLVPLGLATLLLALAGCASHSENRGPADVFCDVNPVTARLGAEGLASFTLHGNPGRVAMIEVRRTGNDVSAKTSGDITGSPPQVLEDDGFTAPAPIIDDSEISAFGAGAAWIIDANTDGTVTIQGTCTGM